MKKALLFVFVFQASILVIGQNSIHSVPKLDESKLHFTKHLPEVTANVIWSSDFSNSGDWTFGNNSNPTADWVIGTSAPTGIASSFMGKIQSSTQSNGFALFDSDALGDNSSTHDAWVEMANSVDLSAYSNVAVEFESYYRKYQDNVLVEVSNDGNNWDPYPVHDALQINQATDNPETVWVNISATAANQPTVWVRFRFTGNWDYAWMVDDVSIIEIPDNDLELEQVFFKHTTLPDSTKTAYYSHIPQQQAQFDSLLFASTVFNKGAIPQPNTSLTTQVKGPVNYADTSAGKNSIAGNTDTLFVQNSPFIPYVKGEYEVNFTISSDSADSELGNNSSTTTFQVGDTVYARDNGQVGNGAWFGPNIKWQCGNLFEVHQPDTVVSICFWFDENTSTGADIIAHIYNASFTPVVSTSTIELSSAEIGKWITIPVPATPLPAGNYIAAFEQVNSNEQVIIATGSASPTAPKHTSFTDEDADNTWEHTEFIPFIRMNFQEKICPSINISTSITTPTCDSTDGSITAIPSGGSAPYTYMWSANSGGQTTQTATGLAARLYSVFILDSNNCLAADTISLNNTAAAALSGNTTNVLCGGICTGAIDLQVTGGTSPYQFNWNNNATTEDLTNICGGGYLITVTDDNNCKSVAHFDIDEPKPLTVSLSESGDTGFGDGLASAEANGGTEPYEYLWNTGDTTATINGLSGGYYSITVTDDNGCTVVDSVYVTGIDLFKKEQPSISLFPNPASEHVQIIIDQTGSINAKIEVFSIDGRVLLSEQTKSNHFQLEVESLSTGNYYIAISTTSYRIVRKLVVVTPN